MLRLVATLLVGLFATSSFPDESPHLLGIGIGSRVVRGRDWRYGDQDGGAGGRGTVVELRRWRASADGDGADASTIGARVLWDQGGRVNTYRFSEVPGAVTSGGAAEAATVGACDLEVVGWRAVSAERLSSVPSYTDIVLEGMRRQMSAPETLSLLRAIFRGLGGTGWRVRRGWDELDDEDLSEEGGEKSLRRQLGVGNNPCTDGWEGIACRDGVIVGLDLASNNLSLPLPRGAPRMLPPELWRLASLGLRSLSLARNPLLAGARFGPQALCNTRTLQFLDASACGLAGPLPECLGRAGLLETVSLHSNDFEGSVPQAWAPLGEADGGHLRLLHLHNNPRLSGTIPDALLRSRALRSITLPQHMAHMLRSGRG